MPVQKRRAKLDLMTGFSDIESIDADMGKDGQGYFPKWTTVGLPDQGRNESIDEDQQPTGSGAPETSLKGAPLKVPMEAQDIKRPKIREGREGREANLKTRSLQRVASQIRLLAPVLARRLMAVSEEIAYDDLSTAGLPESGNEANEVDDDQDDRGHGTLRFFGTDPARSTSLTRESSRTSRSRRACSIKQVEGGDYVLQENGKKVGGPFSDKEAALKAQKKYMKDDKKETDEVQSKLEYASRKQASRRAAPENQGAGMKDINWKNTLDLVESAVQGRYDAQAVSSILDSDYNRTKELLHGKKTSPQQAAGDAVRNGDQPNRGASRKKARAEGDAPLHPKPSDPADDGEGAGGAGGFADRSKAPLQKTMSADDVKRPRIKENPEASRSLWSAFKGVFTKNRDIGGSYNDGRYSIAAKDYGKTLEVIASVQDRDGMQLPVGSLTFSVLNDSPTGRFASIEMNDNLIENRSVEFTMRPKTAARLASWVIKEATDISKEALEHLVV